MRFLHKLRTPVRRLTICFAAAVFLFAAAPIEGSCPDYSYFDCPGVLGDWTLDYSVCRVTWTCFVWLRDCKIETYRSAKTRGVTRECERGCKCWIWN